MGSSLYNFKSNYVLLCVCLHLYRLCIWNMENMKKTYANKKKNTFIMMSIFMEFFVRDAYIFFHYFHRHRVYFKYILKYKYFKIIFEILLILDFILFVFMNFFLEVNSYYFASFTHKKCYFFFKV